MNRYLLSTYYVQWFGRQAIHGGELFFFLNQKSKGTFLKLKSNNRRLEWVVQGAARHRGGENEKKKKREK